MPASLSNKCARPSQILRLTMFILTIEDSSEILFGKRHVVMRGFALVFHWRQRSTRPMGHTDDRLKETRRRGRGERQKEKRRRERERGRTTLRSGRRRNDFRTPHSGNKSHGSPLGGAAQSSLQVVLFPFIRRCCFPSVGW